MHSNSDLERVAGRVASGAQPGAAGCDRLAADGRSHADGSPRSLRDVIRGGTGGGGFDSLGFTTLMHAPG